MALRNLLRKPIVIEGRVLDLRRFLCELRKSLGLLFPERPEHAEPKLYVAEQVELWVRSYVRLCRAAITTLANQKDFNTIDYIQKLHSIRSGDILRVAKGLALEELSLLEVHAVTDEELKQEISAIRTVQEKIVKVLWHEPQKYPSEDLFQGLDGIADFYRDRYGRESA